MTRPTTLAATTRQRPSGGKFFGFLWPLFLPPEAFSEGTRLKTKKVAGVDCNQECFAYVGDAGDTSTWKLCLRIPGDSGQTVNQVKNSLFRFHETKGLPAGQRSALWNRLIGAAIVLGLKVQKDPVVSVTDEEISLLLAEKAANDLTGRMNLEWGKE